MTSPSSASCDDLLQAGQKKVLILYPAAGTASQGAVYRVSNLCTNLLLEKHYDSRDELAPTFYQDDWYLGVSYALNDVANTLLRAGYIKDMEYNTKIYTASLARQFLEGRALLTLRYFASRAPAMARPLSESYGIPCSISRVPRLA